MSSTTLTTVNSLVQTTAVFTDTDVLDTHTAVWECADQAKGAFVSNVFGQCVVTVFDGKNTGVEDRLRIRIWDIDNNDAIIYDNGYLLNNENTQPIDSGKIVIHE